MTSPLTKTWSQVNQGFPVSQGFFAHAGQRNHGLDAGAVTLLQGGEAELAGVADEDDASGHTNDVAGGLVCFELAIVLLTNFGDGVGDGDAYGVGFAARFEQLGTLFEANLHLL